MAVNITHIELDMQDAYGRMFYKLEDEGYPGDYNDEETERIEKEIHQLYWWVYAGTANYREFYEKLKEFYFYYQTKATKKEGINA